MYFRSIIKKFNNLFQNHINIYHIQKNEFKLIENYDELPDLEVHLTDDSRQIRPNSIFYSTFNAKPFLIDALNKNPFGIFITKDEFQKILKDELFEGYCIIGKKSPDFYLGHFSSIFYSQPSKDMYIVAITGTNGKTTTSFMIYHLWKKKSIPCAVIGTLGVYIWNGKHETHIETGFTTPRAYELQKILYDLKKENIHHVVMEASSEALALRRLEGLYIQKAIFTNLGRDHLNFHKDLNDYFFSKLHLFFLTIRNTKEEIALITVYNLNTYYYFLKFSKHTKCNILYLLKSHLNHDFVLNQPMPLTFNKMNALCAYFGVNKHDENLYSLSDSPLVDFPGVPGRVEKITFISNIDIIVDYAHTPDALESILKNLKNLYNNIIIVFGCGGNRDKEKRPEMGLIASKYCDFIFITDDNPRNENPDLIREDILKGIPENKLYIVKEIGERRKAINEAISFVYNQYKTNINKTCLLVAGKGHENYQIIGTQKIHFSDKEVILEYLKEFNEE